MPGIGLLGVTVVAVVVALRAPIRVAMASMIGVLLLIPGFLPVPNPVSPNITVTRVVLIALLARLVIDVRRRNLDRATLRPDRVLISMGVFAALAMVVGVLLADQRVAPADSYFRWWQIADYVLVYAAALFGLRAVGDKRFIVRVLATYAVLLAGIALLERFAITGGYARWWYGSHAGPDFFGSQGLERRGGTRVRASAAFALEFGWVCALLTAVVVSVGATARRWAVRTAPGLLALAAVWTVSRSGLTALGAGLLVAVALSRLEADLTRYVVVLALLAGVTYLALPGISADFRGTRAIQERSTAAREIRWPEASAVASKSPLTGLGLGSLKAFGIESVDNSYLLTYVEMGVLGLVAFTGLLGAALLTAVRALRAPPSAENRRTIAAIATIPILALAGAAAYDLFALPLSQAVVWIAVAACAVQGEALPDRRHITPLALRVAVVVAALVVGIALRLGAHASASSRYVFETLPDRVLVNASSPALVTGTTLAQTACTLIDAEVDQMEAVTVRCRVDLRSQGLGDVWIRTPGTASTERAATHIAGRIRSLLPAFQMRQSEPTAVGLPTLVRTAPVWLPIAALWLMAILPWRRYRMITDDAIVGGSDPGQPARGKLARTPRSPR